MVAMTTGPQRTPAGVAGELVYAIGDVHGCYDLLKDLLAEVATDAATRAAGRRTVVVFLGDYIDRGPQSARVMDALVWLRRRTDLEIHFLKGNHEQAMLEFLDAPERAGPWLSFGGAETLLSYGVVPPAPDARPAVYREARDGLLERMPASHLKLLWQLESMLVIGDYAFVHAGIRPGAALEDQAEDDLLWIRREFLDHPGPFPKIIVHGHTWLSEQPQLSEHRLGIDTGAYATGVLSAVRLEDGVFEVLQVKRADVWAAPAQAIA
jgi:serine/threonine protein phosphatase 1